ncbi:hypothetical protein [Aquimarina sp. ERC-38]|nr:hypothetical protein [Aquimarina sp. ERC-38]
MVITKGGNSLDAGSGGTTYEVQTWCDEGQHWYTDHNHDVE